MNKRIRLKRLYLYFHPFHVLADQILTQFNYGSIKLAKKLSIKLGDKYVPHYINSLYFATNLTSDIESNKPGQQGTNVLRRDLWNIWWRQQGWYRNRIFGKHLLKD